jgi:transcriptional accessory protein Tex/SPT6
MAVSAGEKPTSINDLQPKMELTGVVKKVELFGAFVDVGVGSGWPSPIFHSLAPGMFAM